MSSARAEKTSDELCRQPLRDVSRSRHSGQSCSGRKQGRKQGCPEKNGGREIKA